MSDEPSVNWTRPACDEIDSALAENSRLRPSALVMRAMSPLAIQSMRMLAAVSLPVKSR